MIPKTSMDIWAEFQIAESQSHSRSRVSKTRSENLFTELLQVYNTKNDQAFRLVLQKYGMPSLLKPVHSRDGGLCRSPLILAIEHGLLNIVQFFVCQCPTSIHLPATCGRTRTALQAAAEHGHYDIVKWLIDQGADVNEPPNQKGGATALQLASIEGYSGIMGLLINQGADADAPRAVVHGRTALEGAAEHGRLDAVKLLLDSRTSFTVSDKQKLQRARLRAKDKGYASIVRMLDDYWETHMLEVASRGGIGDLQGNLVDGEESLQDEDNTACSHNCPC